MSNNNFLPVIYKISHNEHVNCCYIGSTIAFKPRMSYHQFQCKQNNPALLYSAINLNGGIENWTFEILKEFYGMTKEELRLEEDKYIKLFKPHLNKNKAHTTPEQKKQDNKERARAFRQKKPNYIKEWNKKRMEQKKKR
jgi:hypothetical protein